MGGGRVASRPCQQNKPGMNSELDWGDRWGDKLEQLVC
jgi:hypothetical protein